MLISFALTSLTAPVRAWPNWEAVCHPEEDSLSPQVPALSRCLSATRGNLLSGRYSLLEMTGKGSQGRSCECRARVFRSFVVNSPFFSESKLKNMFVCNAGISSWLLEIDHLITLVANKHDISLANV